MINCARILSKEFCRLRAREYSQKKKTKKNNNNQKMNMPVYSMHSSEQTDICIL